VEQVAKKIKSKFVGSVVGHPSIISDNPFEIFDLTTDDDAEEDQEKEVNPSSPLSLGEVQRGVDNMKNDAPVYSVEQSGSPPAYSADPLDDELQSFVNMSYNLIEKLRNQGGTGFSDTTVDAYFHALSASKLLIELDRLRP